jgi:hypothetical protein
LFGTEKIFVVEFELSLFDPFLIFGVDEFLASLVLLFDLFLELLMCNGLNAQVLFMDSMVSSMCDSGNIIIGTESWLKGIKPGKPPTESAIKSAETFPENFKVYRNDRGTLGGGVTKCTSAFYGFHGIINV